MSETAAPKLSIKSAMEKMSVQELTALIHAVEEKRREKLEAAKQELIAEFRAKASELGLSFEALLPRAGPQKARARKSEKNAPAKVPAKFRGPNGEEWSGRGRLPNWLSALEADGRKREEFATPKLMLS